MVVCMCKVGNMLCSPLLMASHCSQGCPMETLAWHSGLVFIPSKSTTSQLPQVAFVQLHPSSSRLWPCFCYFSSTWYQVIRHLLLAQPPVAQPHTHIISSHPCPKSVLALGIAPQCFRLGTSPDCLENCSWSKIKKRNSIYAGREWEQIQAVSPYDRQLATHLQTPPWSHGSSHT